MQINAFHRTVFSIISNGSVLPSFNNLKKVVGILSKQEEWNIFFTNIFFDFVIDSLDPDIIVEFINNYNVIPLHFSFIDIEKEFRNQLTNFRDNFNQKSLRSGNPIKSKHRFNPKGKSHVNVIPWDKLWSNHIETSLDIAGISKYNLFTEPEYQTDLLNEVGVIQSLQMPYRSRINFRGDIIECIMWLAVFDDLQEKIDSYCNDNGLDKNVFEGTAVNDILGLGFTSSPPPPYDTETVFYYLLFPTDFDQECYKPTFFDDVIWRVKQTQTLSESFKDVYFLNSRDYRGYGLTRSTYLGEYETFECVSNSLGNLTEDFTFGFFSGKAIKYSCKCNLKENARNRIFSI